MSAVAEIPVDLFNPGQVFACLGLVEAADVLLGDARGGFDWSDPTQVRFKICARGERNPTEVVIEFLESATVFALVPAIATLKGIKVQEVRQLPDEPYPFPCPSTPPILVARIQGQAIKERGGSHNLLDVTYWGENPSSTGRDSFKLWAGRGDGPWMTRNALALLPKHIAQVAADPFGFAAPQSSAFRLDWRRDYIPLDVGFSPNNHESITMLGYPLVELLAALGLTHARPERVTRAVFRYAVIAGPAKLLPPMYLRASLSASTMPFPQRFFRMTLEGIGEQGHERCITTVLEET